MNKLKRALDPFKLVIIAGKVGRATIKYPFEEPLVSKEFRGRIEIDPAKCIGCGACVNVCPPNALEMLEAPDKKVLRYNVGRCIFCWRCVDVCPVKAITGTRDFELATDNSLDLYAYVLHTKAPCEGCNATGEPIRMRKYVIEKDPITENYVSKCVECRKASFVVALSARKVGFVER